MLLTIVGHCSFAILPAVQNFASLVNGIRYKNLRTINNKNQNSRKIAVNRNKLVETLDNLGNQKY